MQKLKNIKNLFLDSISLIPKIGCELEFFLLDKNFQAIKDQALINDFIINLNHKLCDKFSLIYLVEKEQGASQIEIKTIYTDDFSTLVDQLNQTKRFVTEFAKDKNLEISFLSQPFLNDCGNALQLNISLHNLAGENIFIQKNKYFYQTIAALLEGTIKILPILAPNNDDLLRFDLNLNKNLHKAGKYVAPTNLSYGNDNRSAAVRFVESKEKNSMRIEYRVPSANSDPELLILTILNLILDGIINNLDLEKLGYKQVYGNSFDKNYSFKKIVE